MPKNAWKAKRTDPPVGGQIVNLVRCETERKSGVRQHFVTFFSPGTFVHETTRKLIASWDVEKAKGMARSINERYNSKPFGFQFSTSERSETDLDSHETARSPMYFLGGEVATYEEVVARNLPDEVILRDNMKYNGFGRIITNRNSWKIVQPLNDDDVVLDWGAS